MDYELLFAQTIGILSVINWHYNIINTIVKSLFPYESWVMAFFFFLSGILFGRTAYNRKPLDYIRHKCRALLLPALFINLCYGIISTVMRHYHFIEYGEKLSFSSLLISPFLWNDQFANDIPLWFVLYLFIIEAAARILYLIPFEKQSVKDSVLLTASWILSICCIRWSLSLPTASQHMLVIRKAGFFLVFFIFGIFYEHHLRAHAEKLSNPIFGCYLAAGAQIILMTVTDWDCTYNHILMDFHTLPNSWLPYFSFLTASAFILFLARYLSPLLGKSRMLRFIGPNLRYVVYHNQFCQIMIGTAALLIYITAGGLAVPRFNPLGFQKAGHYTFELSTNGFGKLIYLIIPFFVPIFIAKSINKTDNRLVRFIKWCALTAIIIGFFALTGRLFQNELRNIH